MLGRVSFLGLSSFFGGSISGKQNKLLAAISCSADGRFDGTGNSSDVKRPMECCSRSDILFREIYWAYCSDAILSLTTRELHRPLTLPHRRLRVNAAQWKEMSKIIEIEIEALLHPPGRLCFCQTSFVCLFVCLSVCLSLCEQDNSKSYGRIFLKFWGNVGHGIDYK